MTALLHKMKLLADRLPPAELEKVLRYMEGLDQESSRQIPTANSKQTIGHKLAALANQVESEPCDLPDDLAANHDHYLHGLEKRR